MSYQQQDEDPLAYGEDHSRSRAGEGGGPDRGIIGDTFKKLKSRYDQHQTSSAQSYGYSSSSSNQGYYGQQGPATGYPVTGQSAYPGGPPTQQPQQKQDMGQKIFSALHGTVQSIGSDMAGLLGTQYQPQQGKPQQGQYQSQYQSQYPTQPQPSYGQYQQGQGPINTYAGPAQSGKNQYDSFVSPKGGNDVKWYVDGCGYFWAISLALENAKESIWILDWWLSPELYLRRPPSRNEQWRLDRVLQRAAQRGVKVNIIVYKEVTQALTRELISPTVPQYIHSLLPRSTDAVTSLLVRFGLEATAASIEYVEERNPLICPSTVSSAHTKHTLEALSPNIAVLRHPDHLPDAQTTQSSLISSFQGLKLDAAGLSKMGGDALKGIYGMTDDVILYWAHHEKLCLIDGRVAFMGGLDLCFGRWDTNQHSIADAHPSDLSLIAVPGQDYNNAR
jgi:phospholipase D1/2